MADSSKQSPGPSEADVMVDSCKQDESQKKEAAINDMFAYVRFIDDDVCKYVSTSKIKKFDPKLIIYNKKYMVEWENNDYYQAQIIHVRESMTELRDAVCGKRVAFINKNFLNSDVSSQEDDDVDEENRKITKPMKRIKGKEHKVVPKQHNELEHLILNKFKEKTSINVNKGMTTTNVVKKPAKPEIIETVSNTDDKIIIADLKEQMKDKDTLIKELTSLNIQLQRDVININQELVSKLNGNFTEKPNSVISEKLPVGELTANGEIHLGQSIFLKKETYDSVRTLSSTNSQFVKNMALAVFGAKTLKESSVTGRKSNRVKKCNARPALNSSKLQAIHDIYKHHLVQLGTTEVLVDVNVQKVGSYIARKISDLRRAKANEKSHKTPSDDEDQNAEIEDSDKENHQVDDSSEGEEDVDGDGDK